MGLRERPASRPSHHASSARAQSPGFACMERGMSLASVSVVIPTYNSGHLVTDAVNSVLAQSLLPEEIILVDDGSRDDTQDRLVRYGQRIRYIRQDNWGVAAARNRGMQEARGAYVAFLDADDVWHPEKLARQMAALEVNPQVGLLGTDAFDWPVPAWPTVTPKADIPPAVIPWRHLVVKNYFTTSSLLVRRRVLDQVGLFDTTMQGSEDYDLWLRISECTGVANLPLPLTGYRSVAGSLSKQASRMEADMRQILRKLDERKVWGWRWLLRCKAHSYCSYSSAYMHGAAGHTGKAMSRLLASMCWFPFPYRRAEVRVPLARPKMF